jgi:hypothetical protein
MAVINGDFLDLNDIPKIADKQELANKFLKVSGGAGGGQLERSLPSLIFEGCHCEKSMV